jgi:hypothetical protein
VSEIDTSAEAVARLATLLVQPRTYAPVTAATLSALVAERDVARAKAARMQEALVYIKRTWPDSFAARASRAALAQEADHD